MCHRITGGKNADHVVAMLSLVRTDQGLRVENIQNVVKKDDPDFELNFGLFGIDTLEATLQQRLKTGWTRPDLTDENTRYVAPDDLEQADDESEKSEKKVAKFLSMNAPEADELVRKMAAQSTAPNFQPVEISKVVTSENVEQEAGDVEQSSDKLTEE
jgi:hypothetical protein